MRLYVQAENNNPTIEDFIVNASSPNTIDVKNNIINCVVALGASPEIIISNIIPVDNGEKCTFSLTDNIISKSPSNTLTYDIYHNSTLVGTIDASTSSVEFIKAVDTISIRPTVNGSSFSYTTVDILSLNLTSNVKKELILIDSDEISLTKQIKDYGSIGETKATFSNNIKIKFDNNNYKNFGYITPLSQGQIVNYINGKNSFLMDDNNNLITRGKLSIKNIVKSNNNYFINLFFNDDTIGFFNILSEEKVQLPEITIDNDHATKREHQLKSIDKFEEDDDFFIYGFIDNNYQLLNNDSNEQWAANFGAMYNSFETINTNTLDIQSETTTKIPITEGYGNFPKAAEPLIRVKPLLKHIHNLHGYEMKGEILEDPAFYNLVLSLSKDEVAEQEPVPDIVFTNHIEISDSTLKDVGMPLRCTTTNASLYTPFTSANHPTYNYVREVKNSTAIDRLIGDDMSYNISNVYERMHGIHFENSFKTRMLVKVSVEVGYERDRAGFIRFVIADGIHDSSTNKNTLNPFSFMIKEDIYINVLDTPTSFVYTKEIEVDKVQFDRLQDANDLYFIRCYILGSELNMPAAYPIYFEPTVTLTELKPEYKFQPENPYKLNEKSISYSERDLIKDIINKFNIYPVVNEASKTVTYYKFDDYYNKNNSQDALDWSDKIDNSKDIIFDYKPSGIKSSYEFKNKAVNNSNYKKYNDSNEVNWQELILKTDYTVSGKYAISNKIPSLFFTYSPIFDGLRGQAEQTTPSPYVPSEYAMYLDNIAAVRTIGSEQLKLHDTTPYAEKKTVYNNINPSDSIMGYVNSTIGSKFTINSSNNHGKKFMYNRNGTIWIDTDRDSNPTPLYHIGITEFAYPKMLSPFNQIDSNNINGKVDSDFNNFFYSYLGYNYFSTVSSSAYGVNKVSNNLYDMYYKSQVSNMITRGTHMLKGYFKLTNEDYIEGELNRVVKVDNVNYIINKIEKFTEKGLTKVELLKWNLNLNNNNLVYSAKKEAGENWAGYFFSEDSIAIEDGKISSTLGLGHLSIATNYHKPGKMYTVKINCTVVDAAITVDAVISDGDSGAPITLGTVLGIGTNTFEYTYERTDTGTEPYQVLCEKIHLTTGLGKMTINTIDIFEK